MDQIFIYIFLKDKERKESNHKILEENMGEQFYDLRNISNISN